MKKYILSAVTAIAACTASAQSDCDIALGVYAAEGATTLSEANTNYLKNVIAYALSEGNQPYDLNNSQFAIIANADLLDKHIIAGAPTKTVLNINLTLHVTNTADGKTFTSFSTHLDGVGNNQEKAFNSAITKLTAQNKKLVDFAKNAKSRILDYYNRNYPTIINEAKAQAGLKNYDDALYSLMSIPSCCKGYNSAVTEALAIYKMKINHECQQNLASARSAWAAGFNSENAARAASYLSEIYPDAECYSGAMSLYNEIKRHMGEEWKFEMKKWSDEVSIQSQQLKNIREIALALSKNQPKHIFNLIK